MLGQILQELRSAKSALNLNELSHKLGIERSALEGMIVYLAQKGKLQDDDEAMQAVLGACNTGSCGGSCRGPQGCPFAMKMPRTFSLISTDRD